VKRDSLLKIGMRHGTDKPGHQYLPHYDLILTPRRDEPLSLLEIGINNEPTQEGGSLRMWREYLPQAKIFGIDIAPEKAYVEDRIRVFTGPQGDVGFLATVAKEAGPFDIIVDDGSHRSEDHIASFSYLWGHVANGGWYIIEDAQSIFNDCWTKPGEKTILDVIWPRLRDVLRTGTEPINEIRIIGDGCGDGLVMVRKRLNYGFFHLEDITDP